MEQQPVIATTNLSRSFGRFLAVNNVTMTIEQGTIIGLLGANGAGKSTFIRMLSGILRPTSGSALVAGFDVVRDPEEVKKRIGYMSQRFSLYPDLTVIENIRFFAGIYELDAKKEKERSSWVLTMAGLSGKEHLITKDLSTGWKQRLALGCAVLHAPPVLFLDEPTGGVDPVSRRSFWELITSFAREGTTVLVTTHYLDEAEYCNRVFLMHAGRIIRKGSPRELKTPVLNGTMFEIAVSDPVRAMEALQSQAWTESVSIFGTQIHASIIHDKIKQTSSRPATAIYQDKIRACCRAEGISIISMVKVLPSIEDVFITLIQREGRERRLS